MTTVKPHERVQAWYHNQNAMMALRGHFTHPEAKEAFDIAFSKNTPQRFELASRSSNDKIIEQSSMFDQMKGWNDCLNFILSLTLPPKADLAPQTITQYEDSYVEDTYKQNYPTK